MTTIEMVNLISSVLLIFMILVICGMIIYIEIKHKKENKKQEVEKEKRLWESMQMWAIGDIKKDKHLIDPIPQSTFEKRQMEVYDYYQVVTEDGVNWVYYNGFKLPFIVDTLITQKVDDAFDKLVIITFSVYGKMVDSKPINQQNDEKSN